MTAIDTGTEDLRAEIDSGVAVITMNRPERRNAFSQAMVSAMGAVLAQVETDEAVGCVVLTGAGGAFCAGGDVKSMAAPSADRGNGAGPSLDARIHRQRVNQRSTAGRLFKMPKPTLAALAGRGGGRRSLAGAGLRHAHHGLQRDHDHRLRPRRLLRRLRRHLLPDPAGRLGGKARDSTTSPNASPPTRRFGWAWPTGSSPPERELEAKTREVALRLAHGPTVAFRYMKENLNRAMSGELGECMDLEVTHHAHTGLTEDHREAAQAFVDKRPPRFHGR